METGTAKERPGFSSTNSLFSCVLLYFLFTFFFLCTWDTVFIGAVLNDLYSCIDVLELHKILCLNKIIHCNQVLFRNNGYIERGQDFIGGGGGGD